MGAGCKPVGFGLRWFESTTIHDGGVSLSKQAIPQVSRARFAEKDHGRSKRAVRKKREQ